MCYIFIRLSKSFFTAGFLQSILDFPANNEILLFCVVVLKNIRKCGNNQSLNMGNHYRLQCFNAELIE